MAPRSLRVARRVVTDDLRRLHRHLLVALAVILVVEAVALALDLTPFTRGRAGWPQIYPYTIVGMAALVAAMALFRAGRPWARWTGWALATVTLLLGSGVDLGVEFGVLPSTDPSSSGFTWVTALPSLAAVATSIAVLLIPASRRGLVWTRLGLLVFAGSVSALIVLGYLYGSDQLIRSLGVTGTSLPAALIGLLILGAAASARPDQPPLSSLDERYDNRLLRWILPMLVAAPFVPAIVIGLVGMVIPDEATAAAVAELATVLLLVALIAAMGTAQSRARRELLMQRQRVWDAFSQAPAANAIVALDGRIVAANQSLVRLTQRTEAELIGTYVPDLIADGDHIRVAEGIAEVAAGRDSVRREIRFRGIGRNVSWVDLTLAAVRDSDDHVIYLILQGTDLSDRKQLERVLSEHTLRDPLTGLLNQDGLDDQIEVLWRARAPREQVVVVCLDVHDVNGVNTQLGHAAGDDLLREVARRLKLSVRDEDVIARTGGDEFVVVTTVRADDANATQAVVSRLQATLSGPVAVGRDVVPLSVSVGATTLADLADAVPALHRAAQARQTPSGLRRRDTDR
ncbi:MAG: diguanylate cyclase [Actinomycetales bacterium]|nr:diguanylate cyclase [Actinomycetales bacterium]